MGDIQLNIKEMHYIQNQKEIQKMQFFKAEQSVIDLDISKDDDIDAEAEKYANALKNMVENPSIVGEYSHRLKTHKFSFNGAAAILWLIEYENINESEAIQYGQKWIELGYITSIGKDNSFLNKKSCHY